ncbi:MAG: PLP-dependent aminotransferase family protein [Caulobacteraceae bacterium]|nr:PLP-dependent aminotransferase family protein [Caulobacteraceae bacterium]
MARLSARTADLQPSPIREMLSVAQRPGMISFAGGLPDPESFAGVDLAPPPSALLQYGPTEGEPELRARIAAELAGLGLECPPERILVLSGSQQGIDLAAKLVVDPGTAIAVESPAYLAALQVFRFFGARLEVLWVSEAGPPWAGAPPAMAYVTPTFQNPTGRCWSAAERRRLAEACAAERVILFEDDPYRDLAYAPCERGPICASMQGGSWIYQGSFSKTLAPGLRLGFLAASADLFPLLARLKQAADLHTSRLGQWMVARHLADPGRPARLARIVARYRAKRDLFAESLERNLGGIARWDIPKGGLFFWVELDAQASPSALLEAAIQHGVIFTPGAHFFVEPDAAPAMRLNFSLAPPEAAERGLAILGELLRRQAGPRALKSSPSRRSRAGSGR